MERCKNCIYDRVREWHSEELFFCKALGDAKRDDWVFPCPVFEHKDYPIKIEL
jgi:hypothetical protein